MYFTIHLWVNISVLCCEEGMMSKMKHFSPFADWMEESYCASWLRVCVSRWSSSGCGSTGFRANATLASAAGGPNPWSSWRRTGSWWRWWWASSGTCNSWSLVLTSYRLSQHQHRHNTRIQGIFAFWREQHLFFSFEADSYYWLLYSIFYFILAHQPDIHSLQIFK